MEKTMRKKNTTYYVKAAIGILTILIFHIIPPIGMMSEVGTKIFGIYIGTIFLWITTDLIWPSLLACVLIGLSGHTTIGAYLSSGWGNSSLIFVWLCFIFAEFINASGVTTYIATTIVRQKFTRGRPWVIAVVFFLSAYAVGSLVSVTGGIVIAWALFTQYARNVGYKKGEAYPVFVMVGMALAGLGGTSMWTFRSPGNIIIGYVAEAGYSVNFISFAVAAFCFTWIMLALYILVGKFIFKIDVSKSRQEYEFQEAPKLTKYQKQLLFCLALLIVMFMLQSLIPASTSIGAFLSGLGNSGLILMLIIPMAIIRQKETGRAFADIASGTKNGVAWPVFYLLVLNLPIAGLLTNAELGISATITSVLGPLFGGSGGTLIFIIVFTVISLIITAFIGNTPAAVISWTMTFTVAELMGINLAMLGLLTVMLAQTICLLPSSNPVAAMLHGQSDWVTPKQIYLYAGVALVLTFLSAIIIWLVFGGWIFG